MVQELDQGDSDSDDDWGGQLRTRVNAQGASVQHAQGAIGVPQGTRTWDIGGSPEKLQSMQGVQAAGRNGVSNSISQASRNKEFSNRLNTNHLNTGSSGKGGVHLARSSHGEAGTGTSLPAPGSSVPPASIVSPRSRSDVSSIFGRTSSGKQPTVCATPTPNLVARHNHPCGSAHAFHVYDNPA
jgi:hypothetical protein